MIITVDIMKKINSSMVAGAYLTLREIAGDCFLDEKLLETVAGDLDQPIKSMKFFFSAIDRYIEEMKNRVNMLSECYTVIQKTQIASSAIKASEEIPEPPIIW